MIKKIFLLALISLITVQGYIYASAVIPGAAWSRDIAAGGYQDGVPIGGFGAGTITWKNNGRFYLDRLDIGSGDDNGAFTADDANCYFYMYQKPASGAAITDRLDSASLGSGQARYYALFPYAWVDYYGGRFDIKAKVTQFSPIIPNDYQRVSYPLGIYEWELTNNTAEPYDVAVMLTWDNPYGASASVVQNGDFTGIVLNKSGTGAPTLETQGEFCLGSIASPGTTVTRMSASNLSTIVNDFTADGELSDTTGSNTIGGLAFKVTLNPGQSVRIPIAISWDIPVTQSEWGEKWYRKYTTHFDRSGTNSWAIAQEGLTNYAAWESQIDTWQNSVLTNPYYPSWLKSMVFNELYIYFTAGTYWEAGSASGYPDNAGENMFSHLESYIYDFYGTSDVRFYGSWALFLNWPDIDKQCVKQFSDSVFNTRADRPAGLGTTAHDFGDRSDVFTRWNAYTYRDSTTWKDLNSKFVLMVYRDWKLTGQTDTAFLTYCWKSVKIAMEHTHNQDTDGDGLPNSTGIDQTYDDMNLTGDTAYCGGLYLAALLSAKELADAMGNTSLAAVYQGRFDFSRPKYESELWTGIYYKIDTGSSDTTRIMADQMCGQWYAKACGLPNVVADIRAQSAYQKIYDYNFSLFDGGAHGVVNVMNTDGSVDNTSGQTAECWVGTSWGAVSGMAQEGMISQANDIGLSLYNTIWNTGQYWFRTPEAWQAGLSNPRAFYYMRATAVWAVKHAYDLAPGMCSPNTCTPMPTETYTPTPSPIPTVNPCVASYLRINCGGPQETDSFARTWSADQAYSSGGWGYAGGSDENPVSNPITNTNDDVLYQTGHWGSALEYRITVPNGQWRVVLRFAEIYAPFSGPGQRKFNVFIEGNEVINGLDIAGAAGGQYSAVDYTFDAAVSDGVLNITTTNITDNPKFSAIEILDPSILCTPTVTFTSAGSPTATPTITKTHTATPFYSSTSTPTNTLYFSPTRTLIFTITPTYTATPVFAAIRVNAAGESVIDQSLNVWAADKAYSPGSWGYVTAGATNDRIGTISPYNPGDPENRLYQTERWSNSQPNIDYAFDIPNGTYEVTLKFAETYCTSDCREFNVLFEGIQQPGTVDIYPAVGNFAAYDRQYTVNVNDGQLNLRLSQIVGRDWPIINAIKIIRLIPTPTFTALPTQSETLQDTATQTETYSITPTVTPSATLSVTILETSSLTPFVTPVYTPTITLTAAPSSTNTFTPAPALTETPAVTLTFTPSSTFSKTPVISATFTRTYTVTFTYSATLSNTPFYSSTEIFTITKTETGTPLTELTDTFTETPADTPMLTFTNTAAATPTFTASGSQLPTDTFTSTHTVTQALTDTFTPTPDFTPVVQPTKEYQEITNVCVYPNPVNPESVPFLSVKFDISRDSPKITFRIYTPAFRRIREITGENYNAGTRTIQERTNEFKNLSSGIYYYLITAEDDNRKKSNSRVGCVIILH